MRVLSKNLSITEGLLKELKEIFPDKIPRNQIDIEQLWYLQGQQSVIEKLESLFEDAQEEK